MDENMEKLLDEIVEETKNAPVEEPLFEVPGEEEENDPAPNKLLIQSKRKYYALLAIFATVFLLSCVYLVGYFSETGEAADEYDQLASIYQDALQQTQGTKPSQNAGTVVQDTQPGETQAPTISPSLQPLYDMNPDLVGWLDMSDIKISYPVVQSPNRENFYLDHQFNGEENMAGCPYVPNSCDVFKPSDNVVIYGHNLKTNAMFRRLTRYDEKSYWEEHPTFQFSTLYETHTYQIFAVFKTAGTSFREDGSPWGYPYHLKNDFETEEAFNQFIAEVKGAAFTGENAYKGASFYDTGITPVYGDKLLCLSTCEYSVADPNGTINGRFVVMAVRVD